MNLEFMELKLKNFLSFGNVEQTITLNKDPYTLITGLNKDKSGDDSGNRNGVGKTSIYQALHYALYGKSIGNKVNLPNLVNNINKKNMTVSITFKKNDTLYRIERGRNPTFLHVYKGEEEITDESLGDSRDTQSYIESVIGMSDDLFCQTVLLSCNVPIFLDQSTANQKLIIEKVLGIDIITKKINALKEIIKEYKNKINNENFKVETLKTQNQQLKTEYTTQLEGLKQQVQSWKEARQSNIDSLNNQIQMLSVIDYDKELDTIMQWDNYNKLLGETKQKEQHNKEIQNNINGLNTQIQNIDTKLNSLQSIDIKEEKENFAYNDKVKKEEEEYRTACGKRDALKNDYNQLDNALKTLNSKMKELETQKESYKANICPTCHQPMNKELAEQTIKEIDEQLKQIEEGRHQLDITTLEITSHIHEFDYLDNCKFEYKPTKYNTLQELYDVDNQIKSLTENKNSLLSQLEFMKKQIENANSTELIPPTVEPKFKTVEDVYKSKTQLETLTKQLEQQQKEAVNPYVENIKMVEEKLKSIQDIDETELNQLLNEQEHNELLLKLLNSPSSYIRQSILDKSLTFLNAKIKIYLDKLESLHMIKFNNDMSVDISYMGTKFGYVSSGEMGRIAIALTLAFRDAWESLNGINVNLMMIDEVLDKSGLDINGIQLLVKILMENIERNTFVVSHNDEIITTTKNKMMIVRERNFSTITS